MKIKRVAERFALIGFIFCVIALGVVLAAAERYDVLIKGVKIVDGTGKAAYIYGEYRNQGR